MRQEYKPHVAILLCTYNGEKYIAKQIESIINQTFTNWSIWISDDGSTDRTLSIIKSIQQKKNIPITIINGPRAGFSLNFFSLIENINIKSDFYAFCDQDDIWLPEKLTEAVNILSKQKDIAKLYCGRTELIDENERSIGFSPVFRRPPSFTNALVQNIGGGNTMVFNDAMRNILRKIDYSHSIAHDWLSYIAATACSAYVHYDERPFVRYRQHTNNLIGSNQGIVSKIKRLKKLMSGDYQNWISTNLQCIAPLAEMMTVENQAIIQKLTHNRNKVGIKNKYELLSLGLYRQTFLGNLALILSIIINKF